MNSDEEDYSGSGADESQPYDEAEPLDDDDNGSDGYREEGQDAESFAEEEVDERFQLSLPEPLEQVETFDMALPGHGAEKVTVTVNLSQPRRSFEAAYAKEMDALRKETVLRRLGTDAAAVKEFLQKEKKRDAAARGPAKDDSDNDDSGQVYSDDEGEEGAEGDVSQKDGYILLDDDDKDDGDSKKPKSKAMKALRENLLHHRCYPHWLPHLLANDAFYFERTCKVMYGYAVPPPAPLTVSRGGAGMENASGAMGGPQRGGHQPTVSFRPGSGARADGEGGSEDNDEEDDDYSLADPARKPSAFFLKSNAFDSGDAAAEGYNDGDSSRHNSHSNRPGMRLDSLNPDPQKLDDSRTNEDDEEEEDNEEGWAAKERINTAAPSPVMSAAAQSATAKPQQHTASPTTPLGAAVDGDRAVPGTCAGTSAAMTPLTDLPAFTDVNYPFYIVRDSRSEQWQLLDVHPDVHIYRAKQAEARRRRAAAAARRARAQEGGRRRHKDHGGHGDADADAEEEEEEEDMDENESAEGEGETDEGSDDGDEASELSNRKDTKDTFLHTLPQFEKESMIVVDALMLAALRCPAALRLMLLQNPNPPRTNAGEGGGGSGGGDKEAAEDEDADDDDDSEGTGRRKKGDFLEQTAAAEKAVSLRNVEDWMAMDFAVGFPLLSSIYTALLSVRERDAPRLPYSIAASGCDGGRLLLDFNCFFTERYVLSHPGAALRLCGDQQQQPGKDLDPTARPQESVASPRSEAALTTMQSLLRVGIVPRRPIDRHRLSTPESLQLVLWLLLSIPASQLTAWGLAGKTEVLRALESRDEHDGAAAGEDAEDAEDADSDNDREEEAELFPDPDDDDVDDMPEVAVLARVLAQAQFLERRQTRECCRRLRSLKKELGGAMTVNKKNSSSIGPGMYDSDDDDLGSRSGRDGADEVEEQEERTATERRWRALVKDMAACEKELLLATAGEEEGSYHKGSFLPGALLLQTTLEVRRRIALERTGKGASLYPLSLVLERPLAAFARCVEDGRVAGDAVVTTSFHVAPARGSGDGGKSEDAKEAARHKAGLLRKQIIYQSDLALLLLALTTTADKSSATVNAKVHASNGGGGGGGGCAHGDSGKARVIDLRKHTSPDVATAPYSAALPENTDAFPHSHPSPSQPGNGTANGRERSAAAAAARNSVLESLARRSEYPVDAHTELFYVLLCAKLDKQAGKIRAGRPTGNLLDKVRSGMFRLLFLALPRFAQRVAIQLLCDAAPLHELLGSNERVPLMDLVTSWSIEQDGGTNTAATTAAHMSGHASPEAGKQVTSSANSSPLTAGGGARSTYLDPFVRTFWSEIAYRLEAGLYPSNTAETICHLLPRLLDKVRECVLAYIKVVNTLVSGELLKHGAAHRVAVGGGQGHRSKEANHFGGAAADETPEATAAAAATTPPVGEDAAAAAAPQLPLAYLLSPYSEEYQKDEERVRSLLHSLPMSRRTIFTPELLFALLFKASEPDPAAVRYVCTVHHVLHVREGGPFALSTANGKDDEEGKARGLWQSPSAFPMGTTIGRTGSLLSAMARGTTSASVIPLSTTSTTTKKTNSSGKSSPVGVVGREIPALEYAVRTQNLRAACLLVYLGAPLDETSFGGACTLGTLAERCLTAEEVRLLKELARRQEESMKTDPDCRFGMIRFA